MLELTFPNHVEPFGEIRQDYQFTESGLSDLWLKDWPMVEFEGDLCPVLPDPDWFSDVIMRHITYKLEPLNGEEILFARKHLGLRGAALAERLGVERVEVSRWENGRAQMPLNLQGKLRAMIVVLMPVNSELSH
jgi:Helix-turn-helix domain